MAIHTGRREFMALIGGVAIWPIAARAQQLAMPVIGFLNAASPQGYARQLSAFLEGLSENGYVDGRNVAIEYRWAEGHIDRLPALAADLVRRQVTVIAATSTPAAVAAKAATTTIPIVVETGADLVELGLVASLNRPGSNVTGVSQSNGELIPKRLELLHEVIPTAQVMALLINPTNLASAGVELREAMAAADSLGIKLHVLKASAERDFASVFTNLIDLQASGLVVVGDALFNSRIKQIAALSVQHAVPTVYQWREFAAAGGLMSYGSDGTDAYRLAGVYTARILKGDKAAELPVQQATKVEFVINLKTAKTLGLTFPLPLVGRADEVIE